MPQSDRTASRFGRDRDVFPDAARVGPYEAPYDVRRGYQQPLRRPVRRREEAPGTLLFLGRDEEDFLRLGMTLDGQGVV